MKTTVSVMAAVLLSAGVLTYIDTYGDEIVRSQKARRDFAKAHICPSSLNPKLPCKGYVIDHIIPLSCGGKDDPSNMQWQTVAEGKAKDKWERKSCSGS